MADPVLELVTDEESAYLEELRAAARTNPARRDELKALSVDHSLRVQYWRRIGDFCGTRVPGPKVENNV